MKNTPLIFLLILSIPGMYCNDRTQEVEFIPKEVVIKGTTNKMTIQIPKRCDKFQNGVKVAIDAMVKYAEQEASLKASYDKAFVISEFSDRIKTITIAQCVIRKQAVVFDPNESDAEFYNKLTANYMEYQKLRDLSTVSGLNDEQRKMIAKAITDVYTTIYTTKKDELLVAVKDMNISLKGKEGSSFIIFVNGEKACTTTADANGNASCTIKKEYLVPKPDEVTLIKIVESAVGFTTKEANYSLGEFLKKAQDNKKIVLEDNK